GGHGDHRNQQEGGEPSGGGAGGKGTQQATGFPHGGRFEDIGHPVIQAGCLGYVAHCSVSFSGLRAGCPLNSSTTRSATPHQVGLEVITTVRYPDRNPATRRATGSRVTESRPVVGSSRMSKGGSA